MDTDTGSNVISFIYEQKKREINKTYSDDEWVELLAAQLIEMAKQQGVFEDEST